MAQDPVPNQEAKQYLTVTLKIKELMYDIQTKSFNTAESLKASGKLKYDGAAHVMASDDEESLYEQKRAISTAIGDACVELSEYVKEETVSTTEGSPTAASNLLNADIDTPNEKTVAFMFPSNYKNVNKDAFSNSLHDYIVNRAIYVWYRQVIPEVAAACLADATAALEQVRKSMYQRKRPTRPNFNPA